MKLNKNRRNNDASRFKLKLEMKEMKEKKKKSTDL